MPSHAPLFLAATVLLALCTTPAHSQAQSSRTGPALSARDHVYVVARGDVLSTIAARLGVSTASLAERNHLAPPYALRTGASLRLPDGVSESVLRTLPFRPGFAPSTATPTSNPSRNSPPARPNAPAVTARGRRTDPRNPWGRPPYPGIVRFVRESTDEEVTINLRRFRPNTLRRVAHLLRYNDGRTHAIHPRLIRQLRVVSDHFGGRRLHVVSGFRPFRRGQWTPHSNHNIGNAVDFRVEGIANRALRDFCRTLPQTGCGFYPRSVFVHMDVREESVAWVDWSRPGQRPMYGREDRPPAEPTQAAARTTPTTPPPPEPPPTGDADESVDDVADDNARVRSAPTPSEEPNETAPSTAPAPAPNAPSPPPAAP